MSECFWIVERRGVSYVMCYYEVIVSVEQKDIEVTILSVPVHIIDGRHLRQKPNKRTGFPDRSDDIVC